MSNVVYPPLIRFKGPRAKKASVFLAGTIDMGDSLDWQALMIEKIGDKAEIIYNPRREEWDASWEQSITAVPFNSQAHWELGMIERSDIVLVHFLPGSKSPVTMAEFGLVCGLKPGSTIVCCPDGFWRKGNIEIMCERYGIALFADLEEAGAELVHLLEQHQVRGR